MHNLAEEMRNTVLVTLMCLGRLMSLVNIKALTSAQAFLQYHSYIYLGCFPSLSKPPTVECSVTETVPFTSAVCPLAVSIKWLRRFPSSPQTVGTLFKELIKFWTLPPFLLCVEEKTLALQSLCVTLALWTLHFLLPYPDPGTQSSKTGGDSHWGAQSRGLGWVTPDKHRLQFCQKLTALQSTSSPPAEARQG